MGDSYVALFDSAASRKEARGLARRAFDLLLELGFIVEEASKDCVLSGEGHAAGPRCREVYETSEGDETSGFWNLTVSGVVFSSDPWVNEFGLNELTEAVCAHCGEDVGPDFVEALVEQIESFSESGLAPDVECPSCGVASVIHDWQCWPQPGFANFAIVFWNWPPFEDGGWKLDLPLLLEQKLGRPLLRTWGNL